MADIDKLVWNGITYNMIDSGLRSEYVYQNLDQYPVDINTILQRGIYTIYLNSEGRYLNMPEAFLSSMAGFMTVDYGADESNVVQTLYFGVASGSYLSLSPTFIYTRRSIQGAFTAWSPVTMTSSILPLGTDLNNITISGMYSLYNNDLASQKYVNIPPRCIITELIVDSTNLGYCRQILFSTSGSCFFRVKENQANWSSWVPIGDTNIIISRGEDLNTIITNGCYSMYFQQSDNPYLNVPDDFGVNALGVLFVNAPANEQQYVTQILIDPLDGRYWMRKSFDSGVIWSEWANRYANESEYASYSCRKNLIGIFHTIGVIGDSLASGQGRVNDYSHYNDFYDYSWPQCMSRVLRNTVFNFTKSGLSTRSWLTDSMGYPLMSDGQHKCQCYIIGLGANDLELGADYLGSPSDIKPNYQDNADTYYGNYARIISLIKEIEPRAVIFTVENPSYGSAVLRPLFNEAVRYMGTIFDNVYNIEPDSTLYNGENEFIRRNLVSGHYTPAAYQFMAEYLIQRMSAIIYDNPEDFYFVNLIGTQYDTPT